MDEELPQTMGHEAAGVVDELGEGVADVAVGDRVFGLSAEGAAQAELAVLSFFAPIPPSLAEVAEAHRVGEDGHVRGKLVLVIGPATREGL
jgi:Alcohol dehydrogenase GroES-like domain